MEREPGAQARAIRVVAATLNYDTQTPKGKRLVRAIIARDLHVNTGAVWSALIAKSDKPGRKKTHNATSVRVRQLEKAARAAVEAWAAGDSLCKAMEELEAIL